MHEDEKPLRIEYGTDTFTRWILTICASIIALAAGALWQMNGHIAQLDERMAGWTRSMTEQITVLHNSDSETQRALNALAERVRDDERHIFRNDVRIDRLEKRP